jgi:hypothetical protein
MDWEGLHCERCAYPTLLKFEGKPHDLRWGGGGEGAGRGSMRGGRGRGVGGAGGAAPLPSLSPHCR